MIKSGLVFTFLWKKFGDFRDFIMRESRMMMVLRLPLVENHWIRLNLNTTGTLG